MRRHLPNVITLINLFAGCGAIVTLLQGQAVAATWWLIVAGVADYADGGVARALKVQSPLGKELDSLADMVSFGVVPGAIFYYLLLASLPSGVPQWMALSGFMVSVFSGLRLARFNLDTRQTEHFIGLPTPANTIFVTGLLLAYHFNTFGMQVFLGQPWLLGLLIVLLSWLLNAEIPMFSLKIKRLTWQGNEIKIIFVALSIASLFVLGWAAPLAVISLYILVNLGIFFVTRKQAS